MANEAFARVPMSLLALLSDGELRLYLYLSRHQLAFGDEAVRLSDGEILQGRFRKGGKRMDGGAGIRSRNLLRRARESLVERGLLEVRRDHGDAARQRTFYRLTGSTLNPGVGSDLDPDTGFTVDPPGVQDGPGVGSAVNPPGVQIGHPYVKKSSTGRTKRGEPRAGDSQLLKLNLSEPTSEAPIDQVKRGFSRIYAERYNRTYPGRSKDTAVFKRLLSIAGDGGVDEVLQRTTFAAGQSWREQAITPSTVERAWAELVDVAGGRRSTAPPGRIVVGPAPPDDPTAFSGGVVDLTALRAGGTS